MSTLVDLTGRLKALSDPSLVPTIARVTDNAATAFRRDVSALLVRDSVARLPSGFAAYLLHQDAGELSAFPNTYLLPSSLRYLAEGDVVRIDPKRRRLNTLYRRSSRSNSFLVTERCDNYCVMCSQPPKQGA